MGVGQNTYHETTLMQDWNIRYGRILLLTQINCMLILTYSCIGNSRVRICRTNCLQCMRISHECTLRIRYMSIKIRKLRTNLLPRQRLQYSTDFSYLDFHHCSWLLCTKSFYALTFFNLQRLPKSRQQ